MNNSPGRNFFRILKGRELQLKAVVITALSSYILQISAILLHWPFWLIALVTVIPWVPLFAFKILWSSRHYGFMAIYLTLMIVQGGHVVEHLFQMGEYVAYRPQSAAFPGKVIQELPNDPTNKSLHELRSEDGKTVIGRIVTEPALPSDIDIRKTANGSFVLVEHPRCQGWSWNGPGCTSAHGIFGELDRELVHFVWDGVILLACLILLIRYRRNPWTFWAFLAAFIHQIEHVFLFGTSLWHPGYPGAGEFFGVNVAKLDAGFLGRDGVLGSATGLNGFINSILPNRINLHFIYNTLVFLPMVLAFRYQLRQIYDEWLAKAMPNLSREDLIRFSANAENEKFEAGQTIFNQGDSANKFYIITKGQVEILRGDKRGIQKPIANLGAGNYFGEVGILGRTRRTATVKAITPVEVLSLDETTFRSMVAASAESYKDLDFVVRQRVKHLGAIQGKNLERKVEENPDLLVKSRIIQSWLDDMEYKSQLLNWNGLSEPVAVGAQASGAVPATNVMLAERGTVAQPYPAQPTAFSQQPTPIQGQPAVGVQVSAPVASGGMVRERIYQPELGGTPGFKVRAGSSVGQRFDITAPRVIIGRRSSKAALDGSMILVDDQRVSREHAIVTRQPDGFYIVDNGSSNSSWLNGVKLENMPMLLKDGDELRLGPDTIMTFHL